VGALFQAFTAPRGGSERPLAVIASTVKGKGVSFMESNNEWHHNRLTQAQYDAALAELAG
jgi:transketolase